MSRLAEAKEVLRIYHQRMGKITNPSGKESFAFLNNQGVLAALAAIVVKDSHYRSENENEIRSRILEASQGKTMVAQPWGKVFQQSVLDAWVGMRVPVLAVLKTPHTSQEVALKRAAMAAMGDVQ